MPFVAKYVCVGCKQTLTYSQVMHSHGVCPACGRVSIGTIVDHDKVSVKIEPLPDSSLFTWIKSIFN